MEVKYFAGSYGSYGAGLADKNPKEQIKKDLLFTYYVPASCQPK